LTFWHFALAAGGMIAMLASFPLHLYGYEFVAPLVSASFLANAAGMGLFAALVFKHF
jgi:hypothetical protein